MSMYEIDDLLMNSIKFVNRADFEENLKKQIIWNLENIPEMYEFDAGGFSKNEVDSDFDYIKINPYELGAKITTKVNSSNDVNLIYDWSAFLLNFGSEYFSEIDTIENLKSTHLKKMKDVFSQYDFSGYNPLHSTLTIYRDGSEWFDKEQNDLIKWFCS